MMLMFRILALLLLLALLVTCTGCETDLVTGDPTDKPDVVVPADDLTAPASTPTVALTTLDLVNAQRAAGCRCGSQQMPPVAALRLNDQLMAAARAHSADQANMDRMQHQGSDGSSVGQRVTRTGYRWRAVAENVAWNYPTAAAVVEGWFASPGHCRNP